jgi:hypothetical protein
VKNLEEVFGFGWDGAKGKSGRFPPKFWKRGRWWLRGCGEGSEAEGVGSKSQMELCGNFRGRIGGRSGQLE